MITAVRSPLRSLGAILFAALLALSLVATTQDAIAKTMSTNGLPALFDEGFVENAVRHLQRPLGRFGVSWE